MNWNFNRNPGTPSLPLQPRPSAFPVSPNPKSKIPNQKSAFSLSNTDGFWELTFNGLYATVPQHQALFYVAWLLSNPSPVPMSASDLAATVFERSSDHIDFCPAMFAIGCQYENDRVVARILQRKQAAFETVLDYLRPSEQVKSELERELIILSQAETTCLLAGNGLDRNVSRLMSKAFLDLHSALATAVDPKGNPQPVLRAFGRHLLLYILVPSVIASADLSLFTYHPPSGVTWCHSL